MVGIAERYGRKGNKTTEGREDGLKRGKPMIKQGPAFERSKPIKNGKSGNSSRHKRSRMSDRMHRWTSRPWQMREQWTSFWRTRKWSMRKTQALPTYTQPIQKWWVMGRRKERVWFGSGRRESLFWDSCSDSFGGDVLLGWHTTQKKDGWVGTTRCMPWGIARENTHTAVDKNATVSKQTK